MDDNSQQPTQPTTQPVQTGTSAPSENTKSKAQTTQQVSISGYPEQGAVATIDMDEADDDDKDDRMQVAKQEIAKKETPTPIVQMSHPEVLVQKELSQIGVKPAADANRQQLPEEPEQLGDIFTQDQQQVTTAQLGDAELPMTYGEAQLAKRKERSIRKGISWIIREIIRQWKKRFMTNS